MPFIKTNNAEFYYELHGKGQPIVLVGGYSSDHIYWLPILDNLARQYQVLIFDNRAVGQTRDDGVPLTANLLASDVMALCKALQLKKPHIVGQSMGGTIVQTVAALYPNEINKLVILTSSSKWREATLFCCENLLNMRQENVDINLIVDALLPWIFGDKFLSDAENVSEIKKLMIENPHPQSLQDQARQFQFLQQFDGRAQLNLISAPTLIVYGHQDIISLPSESHFMADQIQHSTLVEFDCAHGIALEATERLVEELVRFCS